MTSDFLSDIPDLSDPSSFIGSTVQYRGRAYELARIVGIGMEKVVFVMRDCETGQEPLVLRAYRDTMTPQEYALYQKHLRDHMDSLFNNFPLEGEHYIVVKQDAPDPFFIGKRPVDVMTYIDGLSVRQHLRNLNDEEEQKTLQSLVEKSDLLGLQKLCQERLKNHPLSPRWLAIKGWGEAEAGCYNEAEDSLRKSIDVEPGNPLHYLLLGRVLMNRGRPSEALQVATEATKHNPTPGVWKELTKLNLHAMRLEEAHRCIEQLREFEGETDDLRRLVSELDTLENDLETADNEIEKACEEFAADEEGGSMKRLWQLVERFPLYSDAWFTLGRELLVQEEYDDALRCVGNAYALDRESQNIGAYLGYAEHANGNKRQAINVHLEWAMHNLGLLDSVSRKFYQESEEAPELTEYELLLIAGRKDTIEHCECISLLYADEQDDDNETDQDEAGIKLVHDALQALEEGLERFEMVGIDNTEEA